MFLLFNMRIIVFILGLFFFFKAEILYSQNQWKQVTEIEGKYSFYVNLDQIKEKKGYMFFWQLINYSVKDEYGDLSAKINIQGDCRLNRFRWLRISYHKLSMARDNVESQEPAENYKNWHYPDKNSTSSAVLNYVCNAVGISI